MNSNEIAPFNYLRP